MYGYPRDEAAAVAIDEILSILPECPNVRRVVLVAFDQELADIYEDLLAER